jgi:hypothetical protein
MSESAHNDHKKNTSNEVVEGGIEAAQKNQQKAKKNLSLVDGGRSVSQYKYSALNVVDRSEDRKLGTLYCIQWLIPLSAEDKAAAEQEELLKAQGARRSGRNIVQVKAEEYSWSDHWAYKSIANEGKRKENY